MTPYLWQVTGLGCLLILWILGDQALQSRSPRQGVQRLARAALLGAGLAGLIGAPAWITGAAHAFPWDLPPLAARILAAAGLAYALGFALMLWAGTAGALRLGAWMLLIALLPLVLAIWGWHLDRIDLSDPLTLALAALAILLILAAALALLRLPYNQRGLPGRADTAIALVAGLWGLLLFAWPAGPLVLLWPWPDDPLTTRLIAALLLALAAACALAEGRDERRIALWTALAQGAGTAAAAAPSLPAAPAFPLAALGTAIALTAAWGLLTDRRAGGPAAPANPRG